MENKDIKLENVKVETKDVKDAMVDNKPDIKDVPQVSLEELRMKEKVLKEILETKKIKYNIQKMEKELEEMNDMTISKPKEKIDEPSLEPVKPGEFKLDE